MMRAWAVGLAGLVLGCARGPEAGEGDAAPPSPANARAVLDEARRELADPVRTPLRQGMAIDQDALHHALLRLRAQHGPQVAAGYGASIEALPKGERPAAARFVEVARFELPDEPAARDVEAVSWLFDANVHETTRRVLSTYLALMMHHDVGMTTAQIGVWMAFLRAAEPVLRRCGGDEGPALVLCMDYGADVFVLDMERREPAWVVTRLRWMQARET
jgi:hypothetical protein